MIRWRFSLSFRATYDKEQRPVRYLKYWSINAHRAEPESNRGSQLLRGNTLKSPTVKDYGAVFVGHFQKMIDFHIEMFSLTKASPHVYNDDFGYTRATE